jgi:outer membrane receptor protein involved in Fe transport
VFDGVQVDEPFGGSGAAVEIQPEAVQDLEIITGTFNAEYGRAMSGVVNLITRDGGPKFEGSVSGGHSFYNTSSKDKNGDEIFIGLTPDLNRSQDIKFTLGGPLLGEKITFFTNMRVQENRGHLDGFRVFTVNDSSNFYFDDPDLWYSSKSGDSAYVPMNTGDHVSQLFKLSFNLFEGIR